MKINLIESLYNAINSITLGDMLWLPKCVNIRCHVYVFKYSIY